METKRQQVILAFDGATKTGWAIYKNGTIVTHGTKRFDSNKRIPQYYKWLSKIIEENKITHIVGEDIFREHNHTKDNAFYVLSKMQGVLECVTSLSEIGLTLLNPLLVKSRMIPSFKRYSRNEDKQRMIERIKALGYQLETEKADDEADAIGILITYLNEYNLPVTHPKNNLTGPIRR